MKTNLIFHLCISDNEFFWLNLYKLSFYSRMFDGRVVFSLYQYPDEKKHIPTEVVIQYIKEKINSKTEFFEMEVIPNAESEAFFSLLQIINDDKENITFFAHTKGFSKDGTSYAPYVRKWVDYMYDLNLNDVEKVKSILSKPNKHIAGCFLRKAIPQWNMPWHFSGAFFWFKNSAVFSKNWNIRPRRDRFDLECWPGFMFPIEQAECLGILEENYGGYLDPFTKDCWNLIERSNIKLFN